MAKVAIVTGASRGLGKGCASVLASEAGYTVYATGRTTADLEKLAAECAAAGKGKIIPCSLDQKDDDAVQAFVSKVKAEAGKVDLLVNSAYQGLEAQKPYFAKRFYERPIAEFDAHMNVGVRSSYVMASLVAPMMVEAKQGLIVQISSTGGAQYLFNTPYGVAHAAMDRLTADMAAELTELGVQCVTLWPLSCVTEKAAFPDGESPTFVGRCLAALASAPDDDLKKTNGKVVHTTEIAAKYGVVDTSGAIPVGMFTGPDFSKAVRSYSGCVPLAYYSPDADLASHCVGGGWGVTNSEAAAGWFPGHAGGA